MRPLTAQLEDGYYSITVANHRLIIVIRFVAKSYIIPEEVLQIDFILNFMHGRFFFRETYAKKHRRNQTLPLMIESDAALLV